MRKIRRTWKYKVEGRQQDNISKRLQTLRSRMEVVVTERCIGVVKTCVGEYVSINNEINKRVRNLVCEYRIRSKHPPYARFISD